MVIVPVLPEICVKDPVTFKTPATVILVAAAAVLLEAEMVKLLNPLDPAPVKALPDPFSVTVLVLLVIVPLLVRLPVIV